MIAQLAVLRNDLFEDLSFNSFSVFTGSEQKVACRLYFAQFYRQKESTISIIKSILMILHFQDKKISLRVKHIILKTANSTDFTKMTNDFTQLQRSYAQKKIGNARNRISNPNLYDHANSLQNSGIYFGLRGGRGRFRY